MQKHKPQTYSKELKWQIVQEVISGKYTQAEARREYGIRSKSSILEWMRIFSGHPRRPTKLSHLQSNNSIKNTMDIKIEDRMKDLEKAKLEERIKELEKALFVERHRAMLNEEIVNIAEEEFGLELRKKYGAKQSEDSKKKKK